MEIERHVLDWALSQESLRGRMSFIAGPRQIGKTTAVQRLLNEQGIPQLYYNWDTPTIKRRFAQNPTFFVEDIPSSLERPWIALDEIHKYPKWKNILKGYYDEWNKRVRFIITGSARLDLFRKSGDSLVGRYFLFRMLPLGPREAIGKPLEIQSSWNPSQPLSSLHETSAEFREGTQSLLSFGGFPEPFLASSQDFCSRWRENHNELIVKEDLTDLTQISEIRKLETLLYLLPEKVGSPLSLNALRQTLECAHGTIKSWLEALKLAYLVFTVAPWSTRLARSVVKEEKCYFWDWSLVEDKGARFENFIAVHLMRAVTAWNEWGKGVFYLHYLRTKDGEEVDFAVADRKKIWLLVEVKEGEESLSPSLVKLKGKTGANLAMQVVNKNGLCIQKEKDLFVIGADRFLTLLP